MKALIKYLSVEGKIKEGDKFIIDGITYRCTQKDKHIWMDDVMFDIKNCMKAKPFAVTQDIKVGDIAKFQTEDFGEQIFTVDKANSKYLYGDNPLRMSAASPLIIRAKRKDCYKILGEVSPNATFIEDGKEYEVQYCSIDMKFPKKVTGDKMEDLPTAVMGYKIKCPCCGTFK